MLVIVYDERREMIQTFIDICLRRIQDGASQFRLVDVGASGGVAAKWDVFGSRLWAIGFDPLLAEVKRLQQAESRPNVKYEAAFVGWSDVDRQLPPSQHQGSLEAVEIQPYERSSAVAAQRLQSQNYAQDIFNKGAPLEYSSRRITLDDYFGNEPPPDFIKIDTDGGDLAVVLGARQLLERGVLGLEVEMQFHGGLHGYSNTFSNIDQRLRQAGFSLFDITPYRYTRAALPGPFIYDIAAQTTEGQVVWAEAVYFRDLAYSSYDEVFNYRTTTEAALKLCCVLVLFGLSDCAAELLATHPALAGLPDRMELLNLLTPSTLGRALTYEAYVDRFQSDPGQLFPSRLATTARARAVSSESPAPLVEVPAAVALDSLVDTHFHGRIEKDERTVTLTTAPIRWSYAAEIAIDRSRVTGQGPFCLRLDVHVKHGRIGIGGLDLAGLAFVAEQEVGPHPCFVVADLYLPSLDRVKQIIVRNVHSEGIAAEAVFRSIRLYEPAQDGS